MFTSDPSVGNIVEVVARIAAGIFYIYPDTPRFGIDDEVVHQIDDVAVDEFRLGGIHQYGGIVGDIFKNRFQVCLIEEGDLFAESYQVTVFVLDGKYGCLKVAA